MWQDRVCCCSTNLTCHMAPQRVQTPFGMQRQPRRSYGAHKHAHCIHGSQGRQSLLQSTLIAQLPTDSSYYTVSFLLAYSRTAYASLLQWRAHSCSGACSKLN